MQVSERARERSGLAGLRVSEAGSGRESGIGRGSRWHLETDTFQAPPETIVNVCVYILQSETTRRFYCGQTSDLSRRVRQHNDPCHRETRTTKRFEGPWKLIWFQECLNRSAGMRLEHSIKKRGISRFLEGATATPEIVASGR